MMDSGSSDSDEDATQLKVVMVGNSSVGKSSIVRRFCFNTFKDKYKPTAGVDFFSKKFAISNSQSVVLLQIWDVGGKQLEGKMLDHYLEKCNAICCVYDVTSLSSLENVQTWKECICRVFQDKPLPYMMLVGNKSDILQKEVSADVHEETAKVYGMDSALVSAASGEKVASMFTKITAELSGVELTNTALEWGEEATVCVEKDPITKEKLQKLHAASTYQRHKKGACIVM